MKSYLNPTLTRRVLVLATVFATVFLLPVSQGFLNHADRISSKNLFSGVTGGVNNGYGLGCVAKNERKRPRHSERSRRLQMKIPGQVSKKVIVTGAAGRTGSIVFSLLNSDPRFDVVGLVRSESGAKKLISKTKCSLEEVVICDVTQMQFDITNSENDNNQQGTNPWPRALDNSEAMVICTSAVPQISKLSVIKALLKVPLNILTPNKKPFNFRDLRFKYRPGQYPEMVDYVGQKKQIDFAKKLGVKHVVIVSSMGGTDESNFLNQIGKDKNGNGNGDILIWKRKAEKYLVESGLQYTIIHPGGLVDTEPSKVELVLDVDDNLMKREKKSISRGDVANLCIAALTVSGDRSVSFDCIAPKEEDGEDTEVKSAEEAFRSFLDTGKTANYQL